MSLPAQKTSSVIASPQVRDLLSGNVTLDQAAGAFSTVLSSFADMVKTSEEEATKRLQSANETRYKLEKLASDERILLAYFAQVFPERRAAFDRLFSELDHARETGDTEVVSKAITGIVDIAKSSPLQGMFDLEHVRSELAARRVEL